MALVVVLLPLVAPSAGAAAEHDASLARLSAASRTGVIYDRVLPLARLGELDGTAGAPVATLARWRQGYDELRRAAAVPVGPSLADVAADARQLYRETGVVPLALFDRAFERLAPEAARDGAAWIENSTPPPLERGRAFAAAALVPRTVRGGDVTFQLDASRVFVDGAPSLREVQLDFADGLGFRRLALGERVRVRYSATGTRVLAMRVVRGDGSVAESRFEFDVVGLVAPAPNDTLPVTAAAPYLGQFGTGRGFVYLAPGRTAIENPVIVVEGFDLDNTMNWDELYALLNQENLIETLRSDGFDTVVLDFTDATDAIQRNGLVVAALIQQVEAITPSASVAVVGASMGGLCSRYALAWLEANATAHRARAWLSFDGPHGGAVIPLGLQYWIQFFAGQSADAAEFLAILNRPAARQMLIHHYTDPPSTTGAADPMRATLLADFAALGDYPSLPRRVAIANGSGTGLSQGFAPAAQVIRWQYTSALTDVTGNVWAVPNLVAATIFSGRLRILFSTTTRTVTVSGTQPWDGAPGGSRASFAEIDAVAAPFGDIVALHPAHDFIPTVSALALATGDPFFDIAGAPDLGALTPFDAVYFPTTNQSHVLITPENAAWVRNELLQGLVSVEGGRLEAPLSLAVGPNPTRGDVGFAFTLGRTGMAELRIFAADGREVRRVHRGTLGAGSHRLPWDGRDDAGLGLPAGLYFARLKVDASTAMGKIVLVR